MAENIEHYQTRKFDDECTTKSSNEVKFSQFTLNINAKNFPKVCNK